MLRSTGVTCDDLSDCLTWPLSVNLKKRQGEKKRSSKEVIDFSGTRVVSVFLESELYLCPLSHSHCLIFFFLSKSAFSWHLRLSQWQVTLLQTNFLDGFSNIISSSKNQPPRQMVIITLYSSSDPSVLTGAHILLLFPIILIRHYNVISPWLVF